MHADEILTDAGLVRHLLAAQFRQWAGLPLAPVASAGTDNTIYRLGDNKAVRLPRIHWATGQVAKEREWLPRLAPLLPLQLPVQLAVGEPDADYPYQWAVYRWLPGEHATSAPLAATLRGGPPMATGPSFPSWSDLWDDVATLVRDDRRILILDERYGLASHPSALRARRRHPRRRGTPPRAGRSPGQPADPLHRPRPVGSGGALPPGRCASVKSSTCRPQVEV